MGRAGEDGGQITIYAIWGPFVEVWTRFGKIDVFDFLVDFGQSGLGSRGGMAGLLAQEEPLVKGLFETSIF